MPLKHAFLHKRRSLLVATRFSPDHFWGLGDQALVSAANFFALFLVARYNDVAEVGYYALSMSIVVILIGVQDALITRPYTIQFFSAEATPEERAYSTAKMSLLFGLAGSLLLAIATTVFYLTLGDAAIVPTFAALSGVLTFFLLREFVRRYFIANVEFRKNFYFDTACITTLLGAFVLLIEAGKLNAATAISAMGASYALNVCIWYATRRNVLRASREVFARVVRSSWELGRWILPGRVAMEVQGYLTHWVAAIMLSVSATGAFAACLSVVALSNPFVVGMLNIITPKTVRSIKDKGLEGLRHQLFIDCILIGTFMAAFTAVLFFFGEMIMTIIFPAEAYSGFGNVLSVLALTISIASIGGIATIALTSLKLGKTDSLIAVAICLFYVIAIPIFIHIWGLLGAAFALLMGEFVACSSRWFTLWVLMRHDRFEEMPRAVQHIWSRSVEAYRRNVEV